MTSKVMDLRLRKLEKARKANRFDNMSEEQLNEEINLYLVEVCAPYGTVNAMAEALKASPDRLDQEVAGHLEWYIGYVGEERAAGRMG
ncbi:hypothetical protein FPV16_17860 [Methylobacterium sp. W2]|uniref:hypothetical protein n=1 Tax=Methylobacterium sp. W2 TaxID=2598107 RepID=UPI001D0BFB52|nr:hypothetical protein [Methylobacterium sp. W2]MCC0808053.1 hypothetical protein [Methylobacterium sp. W2]